ncbi:MAG: hypothetical protein ACI3XD_03745 [Oscillospiraceae bacterium]
MGSRCGYSKYRNEGMINVGRGTPVPPDIGTVIVKWRQEAAKRKKQDYDWPLKYVGIIFRYLGQWYNLTTSAINVTNDAYFEVLSDEICNDLSAAGAEDVFCTAILD